MCLYQKIFALTDHLFNVLQIKCISNVNVCNHEIKLALSNLKCLRNEETVEEFIAAAKARNDYAGPESFMTFKITSFEIIDTIVTHLNLKTEKFHFAELLDENQFKT